MKFLVCDKWELNIDDSLVGDYKRISGSVETIPYSNELMRGYDVAYENWCYEYLMQFLPINSTVVEWMGGVGCTGLIIQNIIKPRRHVIYELNADLCKHLEQVFPACYVMHGNAYEAEPEHGAAIHCVDNNTWTALRVERDDNYMSFMGNVFDNADYVLFTDTAISKLHLNKERYARVLGISITDIADYLDALSMYTERHYGHYIIAVATHSRASYILFARQGELFNEIAKAPASAKSYLQRVGQV